MALRIITPPAAEPITLQEAKEHLRVPASITDDDAYITSLIGAARQMAEGKLNRLLMPQVVQFTAPLGGAVRVPRPPLRAVDSITYVDEDGAAQTLAPADYSVNEFADPPTITATYDTTWPPTQGGAEATIQYQAGYASAAAVPLSIKQWILLQIGSMYNHRESIAAGVTVEALPEEFTTWLLQPYRVYE